MQVVDMQESDRELNLLAERNKTLFNAIASSTYPEDYFERCLQTRVLVKKFNVIIVTPHNARRIHPNHGVVLSSRITVDWKVNTLR